MLTVLRPPTPPPTKKVNPIKKFIMKVFKIKEIDYEKFRKEDKWRLKLKVNHLENKVFIEFT